MKRALSPLPPPPDPPAKCPRPPPAAAPQKDLDVLLGKSAYKASLLLKRLGWTTFIKTLQHPSDYSNNLHALPHPAGLYLQRLAHTGVPAPSSAPPWTSQHRRRVLHRGSHSSATHQFHDFLYADMLDMVEKRFWVVLPYAALRHEPHLKLSPCGVVPQRARRPRPIMDYTFTGVNQHSLPLSPIHSMQIGHALPRLLQRIAYADPTQGPLLMAKFDLSDGYYRVRLSPEAALELAVILPSPRKRPLIGIPLSLPMGWTHSPPYFCAFTETAADLANDSSSSVTSPVTPHPLELPSQLEPIPCDTQFTSDCLHPPTAASLQSPLSYVDVYIDDFIALAHRVCAGTTLRRLLNAISSIFRQDPHPQDSSSRKQVISASKLAQGDGTWSTEKIILGWLINTASGTLALPPHKRDRLLELVTSFLPLRRTSRRKWQQLLGELRHMAMAVRGASYLFSILQHVLVDQPNASRVRLNPLVHAALADWCHLAATLATNPVPITTLVPRAPSYVGAVDASQQGLVGFWISSRFGHHPQPTAFRHPFPPNIQAQLVSHSNPMGHITNSDLELSALVAGAATLANTAPTHHALLLCTSDNTPAVSWCGKGSTSTKNPSAFLLWWLALLCRLYRFDLKVVHVPGTTNLIADFCSHSFFLSDQAFLTELQRRFPTQPSWQIAPVMP